jgi:tRNA 2-thiocytidine biosynthesis protein TtcA
MMEDWDRRFPGRTESVLTALQNVVPSHLADNAQFDFKGLTLDTPVAEGDIAFDSPEFPLAGGFPVGVVGT